MTIPQLLGLPSKTPPARSRVFGTGVALALLLLPVAVTGCSDDGAKDCTDKSVYGLEMEFLGCADGSVCSITVVATDGAYSETLECKAEGDTCYCVGAAERVGTYDIRVERDGQVIDTDTTTVEVDDDGCHPDTVNSAAFGLCR